jgi:hypothetical protein
MAQERSQPNLAVPLSHLKRQRLVRLQALFVNLVLMTQVRSRLFEERNRTLSEIKRWPTCIRVNPPSPPRHVLLENASLDLAMFVGVLCKLGELTLSWGKSKRYRISLSKHQYQSPKPSKLQHTDKMRENICRTYKRDSSSSPFERASSEYPMDSRK